LMVLWQGEKQTKFVREDFNAARFNFSHLYTLIQYPETKKYLGITKYESAKPFPLNPVPNSHKKQLEEVLIWVFGSSSLRKESIIKSQNPDLRTLDEILGNSTALEALKESNNLNEAHEYTKQEDRRLEVYVIRSENNLRKAKSLEDHYKGDKTLADKVKSIYEISNEMYAKMKTKLKE